MTIDDAKKILLTNIQTFTPEVKDAMQTILAELDGIEKILPDALAALKKFGLDEDILIATPKALNFLENLPSLPITYTDDEKPFIDKLNAAVSVLRKNPVVWYSLKNLPYEIWRDVVGYENLYKNSNYGRLKSFLNREEKILLTKSNTRNYYITSLFKNKQMKNVRVHRLVAQVFLNNPENKPAVNHKDGHPKNNCVWNLEWVTQSENILHANQMGLIKRLKGENAPSAKFTSEQVRYLREIYKPHDKNFGASALAKRFNVSDRSIMDILHYRSYKDVK